MPITRRTCLSALAGAALCDTRRIPSVLAADVPLRMPLGFSLYGMKNVPVADALKTCAEIGYDGVELALLPDWPTSPKLLSAEARKEIAQRLSDSGLALFALMENISEPVDDAQHKLNLERLRLAAELGHALSPKATPVIETILGRKPSQWGENQDLLVERLRGWAKEAEAHETVIAIKAHVAQALHTPRDAVWLRQQVDSPWLKLTYDYSHFGLQGLELRATLAEMIPQTVFIHVKDARGTPDKFEFLLPGESDLDYATYFREVRSAGYKGAVVVEVSGQIFNRAGYDPVAAARKSYGSLAPAMEKAGVRAAKA